MYYTLLLSVSDVRLQSSMFMQCVSTPPWFKPLMPSLSPLAVIVDIVAIIEKKSDNLY